MGDHKKQQKQQKAPAPADLHQRLEHNLTLHPPTNQDVVSAMETIRAVAKTFGHLVIDLVPVSREQSMALTAIEDACMYAIAGIARNQDAIKEESA